MDGKKPVGIIFPAFKHPYRKYPVFVYLYAVVLYLAGESMRKAARKTAEKFGVPKFSHSTVSRALEALTLKIDELITLCPLKSELSQTPQAITGADCPSPVVLPGQPSLVVRPCWKEARKKAAPRLFSVLSPFFYLQNSGVSLLTGILPSTVVYCCKLSKIG